MYLNVLVDSCAASKHTVNTPGETLRERVSEQDRDRGENDEKQKQSTTKNWMTIMTMMMFGG